MNTFFQPLLMIHIACGSISLILFWLPIFSRKGGFNHRLIGRWYVRFMWGAVVTAALLAARQWLNSDTSSAIFFAFLCLLTARPLWVGIQALEQKHKLTAKYRIIYPLSSAMLVVAGAGLFLYAFQSSSNGSLVVLFYVFGAIGMFSVFDLVAYFKRSDEQRCKRRVTVHMANMCSSGIAAHTAFFAFGAQQIFPASFMDSLGFIPWIVPSVIGLVGISWARRKLS